MQFVYICWYLCNLSLEDLYETSFSAFDLSKLNCIIVDDLPYIFSNMYGVNWRNIDGVHKLFLELERIGIDNNLRIEYLAYRDTIINHTSFLNSIFEVHRRVRDVIFGEKYWNKKMGDIGLSEECYANKWTREKLMEMIKFNTPEEIIKSMYSKNKLKLKTYPSIDDVFLDRNGDVIPEHDDDQDHLRKKNYINGVDRTAWVYSAQPRRERANQRELDKTCSSAPIESRGENFPTEIAEFAGLEDVDFEPVDLHRGMENYGELSREITKENKYNVLVPADFPRPEIILDRLNTKKLIKAGKRLKECHEYALVTEMLGYDEEQQERLQAEVDEYINAKHPPKPKATFKHENDFDDIDITCRDIYNDCTIKPSFARPSRLHSHFPGGVPTHYPGLRYVEMVNGKTLKGNN